MRWSARVCVYSLYGSLPVISASVWARALNEGRCVTDRNGCCSVSVNAHDTGLVHLGASADHYSPAGSTYPALPSYRTLTFYLYPLAESTATPTPTLTPTPFVAQAYLPVIAKSY
jgi:hypothetical protein